MQKRRKIIIAIIAISLSTILIGLLVLSGTLSKYVTSSGAKALARAAKWGIKIDSGSDVTYEIKNKAGTLMVNALDKDGVIVPGSMGSLTYVKTQGSPEVYYDINIDGQESGVQRGFSVGSGFYASSRLVRGENGLATEYFPIIIRLAIYDILSNGTKSKVKSITYAIARTDVAVDNPCANLAELVEEVNSALDDELDVSMNPPTTTEINRVYTVDWEWIYKPKNESYQTTFLDTALCEAVGKNKEKFDIRVNINFEMSQSDTRNKETETGTATEAATN